MREDITCCNNVFPTWLRPCINSEKYSPQNMYFFVLLYCGYVIISQQIHMIYSPISFRVATLALGPLYDGPSASEATLKDMIIIISSFRLGCCPCIIQRGWQNQATPNTGFPSISKRLCQSMNCVHSTGEVPVGCCIKNGWLSLTYLKWTMHKGFIQINDHTFLVHVLMPYSRQQVLCRRLQPNGKKIISYDK